MWITQCGSYSMCSYVTVEKNLLFGSVPCYMQISLCNYASDIT